MELLSPAGSMDCLIAAVQNGADAVYFGGGNFNARRYANNFCGDELARAVDYCHERDVKCYITLNTLLFNRELMGALEFAAELYSLDVDAVLVQDIGLASELKRQLPNLTLHASTQMGIHSLGGLEYAQSLGMTRAVLAREVDLNQIRYLVKNSNIEIETFAHGALCMSFSGSCLYSSMSGERSGNRGTCAQPCRKRASVSGKPSDSDFCLSPNDISMIQYLNELRDAGVSCVKIEGRMKKPEYVAVATRCYREALDGASAADVKKLQQKLFALFNRGDFNSAHLFGDSVKTDRVASSKPDKELVLAAEQSFKKENKKKNIDFTLSLSVGMPAKLTACFSDDKGICKTELSGAVVQKSEKVQSAQLYADRLAKLGDYPFKLNKSNVEMSDDCFLSAADLNFLRRNACDSLLQSLHRRNELLPVSKITFENKRMLIQNKFLYVKVRTADEAEKALKLGADYVGIEPIHFSENELVQLKNLNNKDRLVLVLPNVLINIGAEQKAMEFAKSDVFGGIEINNIGQCNLIDKFALSIAGIGMNIMNSLSFDEALRLGFNYVIPSQELTKAQLNEMCAVHCGNIILLIHGRIPLMHLLHCPVKEHLSCQNCNGNVGSVTDESGREFPLVNTAFPGKCLVRMLNCNTTDLIDIYDEMPDCAGSVMSFIGEDSSAVSDRISAFKRKSCGEQVAKLDGGTRGHWNRKVE